MPAPGGESREELYTNWVAWATTNLGGNPTLVAAAANAAADTAFRGDGLEAATSAARKAWFANAQLNGSWRPGFWKLLLSNPFVWALPALLVVIVVSAFQQPVPRVALVALMLLPIALIIVIWQVGKDALLSLGGTVAAGSLVNVIKDVRSGPRGGGVTSYTAVYEFAFQDQKRTASHGYYNQDSIRQDVMVLFYPRFPGFCRVLPELLNPEST